jgi:MSHA biogenesis protein MshP
VKRGGRGRQRGFSIVSAIFLLVVLSALGAFMVTFSTVQHTTSAQDIQGARAYQAARAGMEWGVYQVLQNGGACAAATSLSLSGALSGFNVNVQCIAPAGSPYTEGESTVHLYQITSTATSGTLGSVGYVERQLQATVSR